MAQGARAAPIRAAIVPRPRVRQAVCKPGLQAPFMTRWCAGASLDELRMRSLSVAMLTSSAQAMIGDVELGALVTPPEVVPSPLQLGFRRRRCGDITCGGQRFMGRKEALETDQAIFR